MVLQTVTVYDPQDKPFSIQVPSLMVSVHDVQRALAAVWKQPKLVKSDSGKVRPTAATFLPAHPGENYYHKAPEPVDVYPAEFDIFTVSDESGAGNLQLELGPLPQNEILNFKEPDHEKFNPKSVDATGQEQTSGKRDSRVKFIWKQTKFWLTNVHDGVPIMPSPQTALSDQLAKCWEEGVRAVNVEFDLGPRGRNHEGDVKDAVADFIKTVSMLKNELMGANFVCRFILIVDYMSFGYVDFPDTFVDQISLCASVTDLIFRVPRQSIPILMWVSKPSKNRGIMSKFRSQFTHSVRSILRLPSSPLRRLGFFRYGCGHR